jgi:hypothetical protein
VTILVKIHTAMHETVNLWISAISLPPGPTRRPALACDVTC